jgi:hypothetical protein
MSGKTAVGATSDERDRADGPATQSVRAVARDALGDRRATAVAYRENVGTLDDPEERWHRGEDVAALPDREFDGWDELYVYTEEHVYRWVAVGFGSGPERLPRDPDALPTDA